MDFTKNPSAEVVRGIRIGNWESLRSQRVYGITGRETKEAEFRWQRRFNWNLPTERPVLPPPEQHLRADTRTWPARARGWTEQADHLIVGKPL